jgi:hypothetical protein
MFYRGRTTRSHQNHSAYQRNHGRKVAKDVLQSLGIMQPRLLRLPRRLIRLASEAIICKGWHPFDHLQRGLLAVDVESDEDKFEQYDVNLPWTAPENRDMLFLLTMGEESYLEHHVNNVVLYRMTGRRSCLLDQHRAGLDHHFHGELVQKYWLKLRMEMEAEFVLWAELEPTVDNWKGSSWCKVLVDNLFTWRAKEVHWRYLKLKELARWRMGELYKSEVKE